MAVLAENNIDAELEHLSDPASIVRFGVMGTPALVINGKVKIVGSVPTRTKSRRGSIKLPIGRDDRWRAANPSGSFAVCSFWPSSRLLPERPRERKHRRRTPGIPVLGWGFSGRPDWNLWTGIPC